MSKTERMRGDKESRETRIDAARRLQEREAELAHVPLMNWTSPFSQLASLAPPGWTYAGKRVYNGDKYDMNNWMAAEAEGWEIVPLSEHPRLRLAKGLTGNEQFQDCVFYKGAVLCKIPTSTLKKRKNDIHKLIYEEIANLKTSLGDRMGTGNTLKPGQFMESTRWSTSDKPWEEEWSSNFGE